MQMAYNIGTNKSTTHPAKREKGNTMLNISTKTINPTASYRVTMTDDVFGDTKTKIMTGADLKELAFAVGHLYDMTADLIETPETEQDAQDTQDAEQTTETTETTGTAEQTEQDAETTPAAEPETETAERAETPEVIARMAEIIEALPARSAWSRAKKEYAAELLSNLRGAAAYAAETGTPSPLTGRETVRAALLNGARDWKEYSYGGCSLIYNGDIAARCCNPSELRRTHGGEKRPNAREDWLDVQARALYQAGAVVLAAYDKATREGVRA